MSKNHPYKQFEKEQVWRVLDRGIRDLVKNGDLEEKTARTHVVGYLAKLLKEAGITQAKVIEIRRDEQVLIRRAG